MPNMQTVHVVRQGECLSSIAHAYGFNSFLVIYEHPANQEFRKKRPDPAVILPGDRIVIPERKLKTASLQTGRCHMFRLTSPVVTIKLYLQDRDGKAIAGKDYVLAVGRKERTGITSSEGLVDERVHVSVTEALLSVPSVGLRMKLRLGALDPVEAVSGVQARLNNLGFGVGAVDGVFGPRTREALVLFQEASGIEKTGELDDNTRAALLKAHGS